MNLPVIGTYSRFREIEGRLDTLLEDLFRYYEMPPRYAYPMFASARLLAKEDINFITKWGPASDVFHDKARMVNIMLTGLATRYDKAFVRPDYFKMPRSFEFLYEMYLKGRGDIRRRRLFFLLQELSALPAKEFEATCTRLGVTYIVLARRLQRMYQRWLNKLGERCLEDFDAFKQLVEFYYGDVDPANSEMDELMDLGIQVGVPLVAAEAAARFLRYPGTTYLFVDWSIRGFSKRKQFIELVDKALSDRSLVMIKSVLSLSIHATENHRTLRPDNKWSKWLGGKRKNKLLATLAELEQELNLKYVA